LTIDRKGRVITEAANVWVLAVQDVFNKSKVAYKGDTLLDGVRRLWAAEWISGHNILQYDIPILQRVSGLKRPATCHVNDTLIRSRVLWPEPGSGPMGDGSDLKAWGAWLVSKGKLKAGKTEFHGPWDHWSQEMEDYCLQDVDVQAAIDEYLGTVPQNELVVRIEHKVTEIIARQTANGWHFDRDGAEKLIAELEIERAGISDELAKVFPPSIETLKTPAYYLVRNIRNPVKSRQFPTKGMAEKAIRTLPREQRGLLEVVPGPLRTKEHPFNPDSGDQIADRLIEKYQWKPYELTEGGKPATNYDVLSRLPYPEVKWLIKYSDNGKMLDSLKDYVTRVSHSRDGKIHGTINVQGCVTGRMSHNQPNLGNVPKGEKDKKGNHLDDFWKIRQLFHARPGMVEVGGDASGLEDRMMRNRLGRFDPNEWTKPPEADMHTTNMEILRAVVPECTRDNAKTYWYAFIYGARPKKQGKIFGKSEAVGEKLDAMFKKGRPILAKLIAWCQNQAKTVKKLRLLDGREVPCRSPHSALNTQLQGDGACVMKVALILLDDALQKKGYVPGVDYEFLGNIHDEFQAESRPEIADLVGKAMVWAITEAGRRLGCKIPLSGEYKIGDSWAKTH
jgi:DNA polymerase-1